MSIENTAYRFLQALEDLDVHSPTVSLDEDGEVSFEWYDNGLPSHRVFSVSVGDGVFSYAGMGVHGSAPFDGIPCAVAEKIRSVIL